MPCFYDVQYIDVLEKEVKQLSTLKPHKRIVTYFGACYAKHPCFDNEKSLFVFTEFMPGVSPVMVLASEPDDIIIIVGLAVFLP